MKNIIAYSILSIFFLLIGCTEDTIDIEKKGSISGVVTDKETGDPLEGVTMTTNPASSSASTDEMGEFRIDNILVDDYSVQAELDGYITAFEPVTVLENETANVIIEMELSDSTNLPPLAPMLVTPEDGATDVPANVDFLWTSSDNDNDQIFYTLELRNGATNEMILVEELEDTTYTMQNLNRGINYFWQVKASDGINDNVESSISSFTTAANETDNRYYFVKKVGDNNVIFSGADEPGVDLNADENVIQITSSSQNSYRPRQNSENNKVAFLRNVGADTHLFVMDRDGSNVQQLTSNVPVAGFRQDEIDFAWYLNGNRIYYPHFNRLYSINFAGNGNTLIYEAPPGVFITEIAVNETNDLVAVKTNDAAGYNARIAVVSPSTGNEIAVALEGEPGAAGGLDFSIDGSNVLYTRDVSGFENPEYRILDSRIFIYYIANDLTVEIDSDRPLGTNDLDSKYSPNESGIVCTNTSNDGASQKDIYFVYLDGNKDRELLFTNAFMPDYE